MRKRSRVTTPPKVLPLLPIAFVAIALGHAALGLAQAVLLLVGLADLADMTRPVVAFGLVSQLVVFVALSFVLRWLVERWVIRHPPRPGAL